MLMGVSEEARGTYHIVKAHAFLPHIRVPLANPRNHQITELLDEYIVEYCARPARHIRMLNSVIDIRNNTNRTVR